MIRPLLNAALAANLLLVSPLGSQAVGAPDEREQARTLLAEGVRLLDAGNAAAALERFEHAYSIFPSARLDYNMALAYRRLNRNAAAFASFERFLRGTNDTGPQVAHAQQELERLAKRVALVSVVADADGLEVTLDGRRAGTTPLAGRIPVDTGPHELQVRTRDSDIRSRRFTAVAGESLELRFDPMTSAAEKAPVPTSAIAAPTAPPIAATPASPIVAAGGEAAREGERESAWRRPTGYGLLGAGVAALAGGVYWLARGDGCPSDRPSGFECRTRPPSALPGWALVTAGAALGAAGGFVLWSGSDRRVSLSVGPLALSLGASM